MSRVGFSFGEQNHNHQVWGALAARLEVLSEEFAFAIDDEHNGTGGNHATGVLTGNRTAYGYSMTSCATDGRNSFEVGAKTSELDNSVLGAPTRLLSHYNTAWEAPRDPWNFDECRSYGINRLVSEQATRLNESPHESLKTVSLRQWIDGALDCIGKNNDDNAGARSSAYLAAALRIAISLAKQVDLAEGTAVNGHSGKMDTFSIGTGSDWSGYVRVRLKETACRKVERVDADEDELQKPWSWEDDTLEDFHIDQLESLKDAATEEGSLEQLGSWDDDEWQQKPMPLAIGNTNGITTEGLENEAVRVSNGNLEAFFKSCFVDAPDEAAPCNYDGPNEFESVLIRLSSFGDDASLHDEDLKQNAQADNSCTQDVSWAEEVLLYTEALTFATNPYKKIEATGSKEKSTRDNAVYKEQVKFILDFFQVNDFDMTRTGMTMAEDEESKIRDANASLTGQDMTFLNVDSAEILPSEGGLSSILNRDALTLQSQTRKIYHLGLVFYELFSGGRKPPPETMDLASMDRAFVSLPTLDLSEKNDNDQSSKRESEHSKRLSISSRGVVSCQISFESLRLIGLPGPLCRLILNMLDCIHEDLSGNECYTRMAEIISDLQLMIDKPHKYFQDLDMTKLTMSGLQMNEIVFPREGEFASIQSCYHRSVSQSYEIAIIVGESGTGKSWLAQRVGKFVVAQGGLFLSGKFDQMQQATPFSVLAAAFDQYCVALIRDRESDWAKLVTRELRVALGPDATHLIKVIPKLSKILTHGLRCGDSVYDQNSVHALQRLCYLLCQFVEVICTFSVVPVTLYLDDVQWADAASILVLNQLLTKAHKKFFFLACYRDFEMRHDHPFWNLIESIRAFDINTTVINVDCMKKDILNQMVSELLCLPPRQVRSLSDIVYNKTKGNPLFFSQLMLSLNREGLLSLSLSRQRWIWNEEEIESRKLPDDVALFFIKGISRLPLEVQLALFTLSLFGASVKYECIEALESQLRAQLLEPLKIAVAEGLVSNLKGSFRFCHDRIQEAAYGMINAEVRCRDHLRYGRCLIGLALRTDDNEMLFIAVNQINLGGRVAGSDEENYVTFAEYNLIAGKRSMQMSDFASSYIFFSHGMAFLPCNHWEDHYQLSLELFELASKAALANGNIQSTRILSDKVLQNARCFEDKLNIYYTIISSLAYASKITEALKKGCAIVSQLGEVIPINISEESTVRHHVEQTRLMVGEKFKVDLLNYRLMTDSNKLTTMKFLAQLEFIAFMVKPTLHPFLTSKMVQLTISHGLSPASPIGFAHFGSILAKLGNIRIGHQLTLLARSLLDKFDSKAIAGEVICLVSEIQCFVEPMQAANELHVQGESASMAAGDVHWACLNRLFYCTTPFWVGVDLSTVSAEVSKACQFMREQQHRTTMIFTMTTLRTILALTGRENNDLTDSELCKTVQENKNPRHRILLSFHHMYRSFMLYNGVGLEEYADEFFQLERNAWLLFASQIGQTFIAGLASFHIYRKTCESAWALRGHKCKADMKLWTEQGSSWNVQHKLLLLEAEEHFSNNKFEAAEKCYQNAIASAKSHKFINDEALACELAAKFYLARGDSASSLKHFNLAHQRYFQWGALAKARRLIEFKEKSFTDFSEVAEMQSNEEMDSRKRRADSLTS